MSTTLYLVRHADVCSKNLMNNIKNDISFQDNNERAVLSVIGEERALKLSKLNDFKGIDAIYSSNYSRAIGTAKYIADFNNIIINIDDRLNERRIGDIQDVEWNEFYSSQMRDFDYKLPDGESINETKKRIIESIKKTGRLVIVAEATESFSVGSELIAIANEGAFLHLEAPPKRVMGFDTIVPLAQGEGHYMISPERIFYEIERTVKF